MDSATKRPAPEIVWNLDLLRVLADLLKASEGRSCAHAVDEFVQFVCSPMVHK